MDTAWLGLLNRFIMMGIVTAAIVIINYPPTKLAITIRHKRSLSLIGIVYIFYQFLVALNIGGTIYTDQKTMIAIARITELTVYISIGIWAFVSVKEVITLR